MGIAHEVCRRRFARLPAATKRSSSTTPHVPPSPTRRGRRRRTSVAPRAPAVQPARRARDARGRGPLVRRRSPRSSSTRSTRSRRSSSAPAAPCARSSRARSPATRPSARSRASSTACCRARSAPPCGSISASAKTAPTSPAARTTSGRLFAARHGPAAELAGLVLHGRRRRRRHVAGTPQVFAFAGIFLGIGRVREPLLRSPAPLSIGSAAHREWRSLIRLGGTGAGSLLSMGILNKRNAVLGWAAWTVGKAAMKSKARRCERTFRAPKKGAIAAGLVAVGGALLFWRRNRGDEPA